MKLTVYTPDRKTFASYYYGYGQVISQEEVEANERKTIRTVIDYGDDSYRATYQRGRFWSGLYAAELDEEF